MLSDGTILKRMVRCSEDGIWMRVKLELHLNQEPRIDLNLINMHFMCGLYPYI